MGLDRTGLFLHLRDALPPADAAAYAALVERCLAGEPVAYLTGEREFMGLRFAVRPGVLIPRPETETLVEWALARIAAQPRATVVDIGTGSGAIALALAAHLPSAWSGTIVASDVSAEALAIAAENRAHLGLANRVGLVRGNLATWYHGPVDLLLANLPYLRPDQLEINPDLRAEPVLALVGGADGLDPIRRLVADAPRLLAPGGALGLEIDPSQAAVVRGLVAATLPGATIAVRPDLAGLARHVLAERREDAPSGPR